jgi:hypothetical protein
MPGKRQVLKLEARRCKPDAKGQTGGEVDGQKPVEGRWRGGRRPDGKGKVFFSFVFLCSKEHFSIFFVQYLGVTAGIEPAWRES